MFRVALNGDDEIEAGFGSGATACNVKRGAMLAHFEHLAGDKNAAAVGGARGQRANHGAKGFGVGVVAIVEDGCAGDFDDLAALVAGSERSDGLDGSVDLNARLERDGEAGDGVYRVVRAEHLKGEVAFATADAIADVQAVEIFGGREDLRVGAGTTAKVDDMAGKVAAKLRGVNVVAIEEGYAVGRERGDQLEFGAGNARLALGEELDVRRCRRW